MLVQSQHLKIMCQHCAGDLKRCFHSGPWFFLIQWRCADIFHSFFGRTCCNFPRFCIPHFFDQLSTQQCQSWHQCMVRESDHSGFSFSSLCFGSPEKAGPSGPAYETLSGCHGGFSPRNFGICGPKLWRHELHLQKMIFHPCFQLFLDLVSFFLLFGSPGYWSYHVFRNDQKKNSLEYPFVDRTSDTKTVVVD